MSKDNRDNWGHTLDMRVPDETPTIHSNQSDIQGPFIQVTEHPAGSTGEIPHLSTLKSVGVPVSHDGLNAAETAFHPPISLEILDHYLGTEDPLSNTIETTHQAITTEQQQWIDEQTVPEPVIVSNRAEHKQNVLLIQVSEIDSVHAIHTLRVPENANALPLIFVSGLCNNSDSLKNLEQSLYNKSHIISHIDWHKHENDTITGMNIQKYALALKAEIDAVKKATKLNKVGLVGHSMGTAIINKYIQLFGEDDIETVALLAPVPAGGALIPTLKLFGEKGGFTTLLKTIWRGGVKKEGMNPFLENEELVKRVFYREGFPEELFKKAYALLGNDSFWAYAWDMIVKHPFTGQSDISVPLFIASGTEDFISPPKDLNNIAKRAGQPDATIKEYEGMGHALALEPDFEDIARDLQAFLKKSALTLTPLRDVQQ